MRRDVLAAGGDDQVLFAIGDAQKPVRVLVLSPDSRYVAWIATILREEPEEIKRKIRATVDDVRALKDRELHVELRFYDAPPTFRIVIVDEAEAYLSFYEAVPGGGNPPQFLFRSRREHSFFPAIQRHFDAIWAGPPLRDA